MIIQLRKCNLLNEVYAVISRTGSGFCCYCLNDDTHADISADFIRRRTTAVKTGIPELLQITSRRYEGILINAKNLTQIK